MLSDYLKSKKETFIIEENTDFPDVLMIKARGPNQVEPVAKGKPFYKNIDFVQDFRNYC